MNKKIRNFFLILISIFLINCTGKDTARSVAEIFLKAMSTEDFETAKKYGTQETERLLDMMSGFTKMSVDSARKEMKFEIIKEEQLGENATIFYKENGREGELQLPMVKIDGKWKVLLTKESINNSEGNGSINIGATSTDSISK